MNRKKAFSAGLLVGVLGAVAGVVGGSTLFAAWLASKRLGLLP